MFVGGLGRTPARAITTRAAFYERIDAALGAIRAAGTYKTERVLESPQQSAVRVAARPPAINLCANNYLGLCSDPSVVQAAQAAAGTHGAGLGSVRFICGTQGLHKHLEARLTAFHRTGDTILYSSCFDANAGLFEALLGKDDLVVSDALNHASIIDGIRMCRAERQRYRHGDMADLERVLRSSSAAGARMIVTDGVFSMDGDLARLDRICTLADRHDALVFVDDCHATGLVGPTGRGTPELFGLEQRIDVLNSTLGKALGGASGGYTTGRKPLVELLRQRARPYLFSNTLAPAPAPAALRALELVDERPELRQQLARNTQHFRSGMAPAASACSAAPSTRSPPSWSATPRSPPASPTS